MDIKPVMNMEIKGKMYDCSKTQHKCCNHSVHLLSANVSRHDAGDVCDHVSNSTFTVFRRFLCRLTECGGGCGWVGASLTAD